MDASVVRNDIGMSTLPRDFESLPFIKEHLRHQYRSILIEQMVHLWTLDGNRFPGPSHQKLPYLRYPTIVMCGGDSGKASSPGNWRRHPPGSNHRCAIRWIDSRCRSTYSHHGKTNRPVAVNMPNWNAILGPRLICAREISISSTLALLADVG